MKKEQKKVNKKFKNKRSTYETSYIDYNFMNNVVRFGLETAQKMREEAYYKELASKAKIDISRVEKIYGGAAWI